MSRSLAILYVFCFLLVVDIAIRLVSAFYVERNELVFVRNIPYAMQVAHVVDDNGDIVVRRLYPLFIDDPRDGIWSKRLLDIDPMDVIAFVDHSPTTEKHGILLCFQKDGGKHVTVFWYNPAAAVTLPRGRKEWDINHGIAQQLTNDDLMRPGLESIRECGR